MTKWKPTPMMNSYAPPKGPRKMGSPSKSTPKIDQVMKDLLNMSVKDAQDYTASKTKTSTSNPTSRGAGGFRSYTHYGRSGKSNKKITTAINRAGKKCLINNVVNTQRLNSSVGLQSVALLHNLYNSIDIQTQATQVGAVVNSATQRSFLKSGKVITTLKNVCPGIIDLTLYDCVPRNDQNGSSVVNPAIAWTTGVTNESGGSAASNPGSTPFQSDLFTQTFRVVKSTKVFLQPGATLIHTLATRPNRLFNITRLNQATAGVRNLTGYTFIRFNGSLGNDSTTKTQISLDASALDVLTTVQYESYGHQEEVTALSTANTLPTGYTVGGEIINDLTGAVVPDNVTNEA